MGLPLHGQLSELSPSHITIYTLIPYMKVTLPKPLYRLVGTSSSTSGVAAAMTAPKPRQTSEEQTVSALRSPQGTHALGTHTMIQCVGTHRLSLRRRQEHIFSRRVCGRRYAQDGGREADVADSSSVQHAGRSTVAYRYCKGAQVPAPEGAHGEGGWIRSDL